MKLWPSETLSGQLQGVSEELRLDASDKSKRSPVFDVGRVICWLLTASGDGERLLLRAFTHITKLSLVGVLTADSSVGVRCWETNRVLRYQFVREVKDGQTCPSSDYVDPFSSNLSRFSTWMSILGDWIFSKSWLRWVYSGTSAAAKTPQGTKHTALNSDLIFIKVDSACREWSWVGRGLQDTYQSVQSK